ncbi:MAG: hypothetical protein JKY34_05935 [Kordiimonadaceae bacterium]|nr:hypothetical protein [Kordiimonadaceae bacterium]
MNSFNHYAYGAVGGFFFENLAGISPVIDKPGYAEIQIKPILDEQVPLTHASASLETRYGTASNRWEKTPEGWEMVTAIPANASGIITLPFSNADIEVKSGEINFVSSPRGVTAKVPAGTYRIAIKK